MVRMLGIRGVSSLWQTKNSDCACGIMVPVQDGSGIEICSAICTCVNRWIPNYFHHSRHLHYVHA